MITVLSFIVAILILVSLHELGHYIVARLCGVKVLRFSIGFGKPFWVKKKGDTEWALAPIPLGGYVRMVDTREGAVSLNDLPYAFDLQHPLKRIAIVVAGPITNLLLAVILFAAYFSMGVIEFKPMVGDVIPYSIAAKAGFVPGDEILSVNGDPIEDWADASVKMVIGLGKGNVDFEVKSAQGKVEKKNINIQNQPEEIKEIASTGDTGLRVLKQTTVLGFIQPDSPADKAGLKVGDQLLKIDGQPLKEWLLIEEAFRRSPGKELKITFLRAGQEQTVQLRPDSIEVKDVLIGKVGVRAKVDENWLKKVSYRDQPSFFQAIKLGYDKTSSLSWLTLKTLVNMVLGQTSLDYLSGPITIANLAGQHARMGFQAYLNFLALVSLSLGVLNLLPIPVLDGGHLLYYSIEWIRGKPLSRRVQEAGLRFGLMAMLLLMFVAFFNDISRFFG